MSLVYPKSKIPPIKIKTQIGDSKEDILYPRNKRLKKLLKRLKDKKKRLREEQRQKDKKQLEDAIKNNPDVWDAEKFEEMERDKKKRKRDVKQPKGSI